MQQAFLIKPGEIEIRDVPVPEPGEGEIVVKIDTALTCGTDLKAYMRGHRLIPMPGPFGHEYSGTVAKTGNGVIRFREGDSIMGVHSGPCLSCRYCKKGLHNLCENIMDSKVLGAFAKHILIPSHVVEQNIFIKPDNLSFEEAALLEPFATVLHPYSKLSLGEIETALVIGAGPIGLMHLAHLQMNGIHVIMSDLSGERMNIAKKAGANKVASPEDLKGIVNDETDGMGVDLVIECAGSKTIWENSTDYLRRGGTVVLFGGCPPDTEVTYNADRLHYDEITMVGSFHFTPDDVQRAFHLLGSKEIDLSHLITGRFGLNEIEKAFSLLKEHKGIKYAIRP